ncbi:DUF6686 family protein [uncultured Sunxiuqinia sp.]|uniref:DUF6686 family protein n=1 Tax=uncultured Sunxiuqinia sp. TaxID=1573825 RepID=UPI0026128875|nr:DUF6686 family protein [uncultured Sunxiuqinia sp.]
MKKLSENGQLFICDACRKIHLEYGNVGMDFISEKKLNELMQYLRTVRSSHFANETLKNNDRRQILIPFANTPIKLLLSDWEIVEIIRLIQVFLDEPKPSKFTHFKLINPKKISALTRISPN